MWHPFPESMFSSGSSSLDCQLARPMLDITGPRSCSTTKSCHQGILGGSAPCSSVILSIIWFLNFSIHPWGIIWTLPPPPPPQHTHPEVRFFLMEYLQEMEFLRGRVLEEKSFHGGIWILIANKLIWFNDHILTTYQLPLIATYYRSSLPDQLLHYSWTPLCHTRLSRTPRYLEQNIGFPLDLPLFFQSFSISFSISNTPLPRTVSLSPWLKSTLAILNFIVPKKHWSTSVRKCSQGTSWQDVLKADKCIDVFMVTKAKSDWLDLLLRMQKATSCWYLLILGIKFQSSHGWKSKNQWKTLATQAKSWPMEVIPI